MYLLSPYYNELVNEFNEQVKDNSALKHHYSYFVEMQTEFEKLQLEHKLLKQAEGDMINQMKTSRQENAMLEQKAKKLE